MIDQVRLARACAALCLPLGHGLLWRDGEPTDRAVAYRDGKRVPKRVQQLVRVAWQIWWDQPVDATALDPADVNAVAVVGLVCAIEQGPEAVDRWIDEQHARARRTG